MQITAVQIKLMDDAHGKLLAYATATFDKSFVVNDLRLIRGRQGMFVAMPFRRQLIRCSRCVARICSRSRYCPSCGTLVGSPDGSFDAEETRYPTQDIAHPINAEFRACIESAIIAEYEEVLRLSLLNSDSELCAVPAGASA